MNSFYLSFYSGRYCDTHIFKLKIILYGLKVLTVINTTGIFFSAVFIAFNIVSFFEQSYSFDVLKFIVYSLYIPIECWTFCLLNCLFIEGSSLWSWAKLKVLLLQKQNEKQEQGRRPEREVSLHDEMCTCNLWNLQKKFSFSKWRLLLLSNLISGCWVMHKTLSGWNYFSCKKCVT